MGKTEGFYGEIENETLGRGLYCLYNNPLLLANHGPMRTASFVSKGNTPNDPVTLHWAPLLKDSLFTITGMLKTKLLDCDSWGVNPSNWVC